MSFEFVIFLLAGAALGGFINGLAGFGTALFALGFWLQIMPPVQAVAIVVVMSVVSGLQGVWLVRRAMMSQRRRLARFLLPALPGIPLGVAALSVLSADVLKAVIAGFMLLYGGFFGFRAALPKFERPTPVGDMAVGFLGGVLGGAASLSGALPTMWCALRPWPKAEVRAVLQPFNVTVLGLTALTLAIQGTYDRETLIFIAVALPVTMISAQIGIAVFKRLNDDGFRRLVIAMMLVSGVMLLARVAL
ncbi:sulfite exporter TauE/SafE family protein [Jannaschia sp. KMU-145]|uniref:sulfite exporter TauE/SafE family protein n=1 Tax=Jannaschia halovivens TaxID=3388667 RepID=UPI00396AFB22